MKLRGTLTGLALGFALVGGVLPATPASAAPVATVNPSATSAADKVWQIFSFYPDYSTCEAQGRYGAHMAWWFSDWACATNGREIVLLVRWTGSGD